MPAEYGANLKGSEGFDWKSLTELLPTSRSPDHVAKRKAMFKKVDYNGNGYLSLAEVDKAVRDELKIPALFDAKPVLMRAFQAAKGAAKTKAERGAHYVERHEFRILLLYLRQYLELFVMFNRMDTGDDMRVSIAEFIEALPLLKKWGVDLTEDEAEVEFTRIDKNGGGLILFDEYCAWAMAKEFAGNGLDLEDDDDWGEDEGGFRMQLPETATAPGTIQVSSLAQASSVAAPGTCRETVTTKAKSSAHPSLPRSPAPLGRQMSATKNFLAHVGSNLAEGNADIDAGHISSQNEADLHLFRSGTLSLPVGVLGAAAAALPQSYKCGSTAPSCRSQRKKVPPKVLQRPSSSPGAKFTPATSLRDTFVTKSERMTTRSPQTFSFARSSRESKSAVFRNGDTVRLWDRDVIHEPTQQRVRRLDTGRGRGERIKIEGLKREHLEKDALIEVAGASFKQLVSGLWAWQHKQALPLFVGATTAGASLFASSRASSRAPAPPRSSAQPQPTRALSSVLTASRSTARSDF